MSRYQHFDDEFSTTEPIEAAVLPELDVDEPHQLEFKPQLRNYSISHGSSSTNKLKLNPIKFFLTRRTRFERYLIIINLILLFIICVNFLTYIYHRNSKIFVDETCLTPECIQISSSIYAGMNQTVDPCENFYEFVCGRWTKTHLIPKGHSSWSITNELSQKSLIILKSILEETITTNSTSSFNAEQEAIKFYQSCLNVTEIDRLQHQPLQLFFKENLDLTLNQWININQSQTWQNLFSFLTKKFSSKFGFSCLLSVWIGPDDKNSSWNVLHINQPELILGNRDYYINSSINNRSDIEANERNRQIVETYRKVGAQLLELIGFEKSEAEKRMNDIIEFETKLALVSLPVEILQKPNETYYLISLKKLQELYKSTGLDIYSFFNEMVNINETNPIHLNENDQIIVLSIEHVSNVAAILDDYLSKSNRSHIVIDYLLFSLLFNLSPHLSSSFENVLLSLSKELEGIVSPPERWERCVKQTDAAFSYGLASLYIKAAFGEEDRKIAREIVKNIRQALNETFDSLHWIDEPSKIEAKRKLEKMREKIGYPDFINDGKKLNERYMGYTMMENEYFNNQIKVFVRENRRSILKFRQKVDSSDWGMTPRSVNAYYSESANEIAFPAGILQAPFFHKQFPIAVNYGAIGTVIGHEITHGFDAQGREYDADGNMRSWWTKASSDRFEEKAKCFVQQYSNYSLDGQNENGQRTLSENLADNGGLKLSYFAYQKEKTNSLNNGNNNLRLPGLPYHADQLFFIAFAHSWCTIETRNSIRNDLINDPHSLVQLRIMGTLANSPAFAQAFSCKSKTKMNPSNKCQLW